jgi:hypothetical protein
MFRPHRANFQHIFLIFKESTALYTLSIVPLMYVVTILILVLQDVCSSYVCVATAARSVGHRAGTVLER